ncbi:hypothetical protein LBMAG15_16150 [Actinomycetes bacterium]|nr:hypothetical protein LBMAG15_16150 [Actinomycetes bacterium]
MRIGMGVALILIPAIILIVGGAWVAAVMPTLGIIAIVIGVLLFLFGSLVGSALRAIFSVAIYRFAQDESAIGDFTTAELAGVLTAKKWVVPWGPWARDLYVRQYCQRWVLSLASTAPMHRLVGQIGFPGVS